MSVGSFSMGGKKERARKFHIADKNSGDPLVIIAKDETDAAAIWAKRTSRDAKDAVASPIGNKGVPVARKPSKETKDK